MPSKKAADESLLEAQVIRPLNTFAKSSYYFIKKCEKPDRKQLTELVVNTGAGFLIMGFVGFFVKLIHIPINNIIVGA